MDIFAPITQSQLLIKQLSSAIKHKTNPEIDSLLKMLSSHLVEIEITTSAMQQQIKLLNKNQTHSQKGTVIITTKPEIKSGCYIFSGEKGFFCPQCYDKHDNKVATTRLNSKLRICPVCRASIK